MGGGDRKEVKIEKWNERIKGRGEDGWKDEGGKWSKMELKIKGIWRDDGQRGNYIERGREVWRMSPAAKTRQWKKTSFRPSGVRKLKQSTLKQLLASIYWPSVDLFNTHELAKNKQPLFYREVVMRVPLTRYCRKQTRMTWCDSIHLFYVRFPIHACDKNSSGKQLDTRWLRPGTLRGSIPGSPSCTPNYPAGRVTTSNCWVWMAEQISSRLGE